MESRRAQREEYLRRRRERRRRLTLRWFVLLGCIVVLVFAVLILTDSCEASRRTPTGALGPTYGLQMEVRPGEVSL